MLLLSGIYASILGTHNVISVNKFYEEADQNLRNVNDMVREKAYHSLMEIIHNVTKKRNPNIYMIQAYLVQNFSAYINKTFPLVTQNYNVTVNNYSIKVVMDYMKTREFIKDFKLRWIDYSFGIDNSVEGFKKKTMLPVYPYVVGFLNYTYHDKRTGYSMKRSMNFNRIVYSPLPLLKFEFDEFNTSTTNLGDFGRLIRYILTTLVEYRILQGYAAGQYSGTNVPVTEVLTKQDVEKAVNLALLLESIRYFRTYDSNTAKAMGINGIIERYAKDGTIDAADIYFLWNRIGTHFSIARIIGQTIYGYADRFVYELMRIFWGDQLSNYFADPTLKEPLLNWQKIKGKGDAWIKEMLSIYLNKWREWLQIPKTILPHLAQAKISVGFKILIIIPGTPPIIYTVPATAKMTWIIESSGISNTVNLILDKNREYFTVHAIGISTDPPLVLSHTYNYNLVKESFVEEHQNYANGDSYYNTLKYVMDALTRSMKKRSDTWNDVQNKGFVDYAAYDTAQRVKDVNETIYGNPKDENTILLNGTKQIIYGPLEQGAQVFSNLVPVRKETWWKYGAYKSSANSSDSNAYLYYLTKDTVDLWYQAMKNLYDGGDPSPTDDAGPYASDCDSYPPSYQVSTWPTGYEGYPFYGNKFNGSFNFHRDLTRDAYNDIKIIMLLKAIEEGAKAGGLGIPIYTKSTVWNEVKTQTEKARQNVVGKNGLIKDLNFHFPYLYFNPVYLTTQNFGDLRGFLDYITDTGAYKTNFYRFVRWRVGLRILGYLGMPPASSPGGGGNNSGGGGNNTTVTGKGLDVSHYQGSIDWTAVHNAGYNFAFVKATGGTSYDDPDFAQNINNGYAAGMKLGAYHFAYPASDNPIVEADHFVNVIKPYLGKMQLPPALDLETGSSLGKTKLSQWVNSFMSEVQSKTGLTPVIYTSSNYASNYLDSSVTQWPLWIADWTYNPNSTPSTGIWSSWSYWQYSDKGTVPGISGDVDLDVAAGSTAMQARTALGATGNNILDNLTYWIPESLNVLYKNIMLNANYSSIPIFLNMHSSRYIFWNTKLSLDTYAERTKNETMVVDFLPDYLKEGKNINISINLKPGHKFVDVQDINYNMGKAPYEYQFSVKINGKLNMNLRTDRTSLVYGGKHWYTWYNNTVPINLNIDIPVYTAWFLESHWNKCTSQDNWAFHTDVPFNYTRGYFHIEGKDSPTKPFFVSKELNTFIYNYEKIGEIWNRYSTFNHFALVNIKDEMAAWNFTYHRIILNATSETTAALNNAASGFSTVENDINALFSKANGYTTQFQFFYFARDFTIKNGEVDENNGYQKYFVTPSSREVKETYKEDQFTLNGELSGSGINININEIYDRTHINLNIAHGNIKRYFASYDSYTGQKKIKMYVESLGAVYSIDFGFVGDSSEVTQLTKYFPKKINGSSLNQEELIALFHTLLKDIYLNESINYRLGIFVNVMIHNMNLTYVVWFNSSPTTNSFIIWLNNVVRPIVYRIGISEFPQYAYDRLTLNNVYYSVNNLWMDTNYESSSIFGYANQGMFKAAWDNYMINMNYNI